MSWLDILGLGADLLNVGYNAYTNKRDFDYQKNLQNEIFSREDNSVQRRVKDLQAAGLNPALAAGQGAGAGSVVSRSNTDSLGAKLDTVQAINQIQMQKQETKNAQEQQKILQEQKAQLQFDNNFDMYSKLSALGFDVTPQIFSTKNGRLGLDMMINYDLGNPMQTTLMPDGDHRYYYPKNQKYRNMVLGELNTNFDYLKNSAELLQKDVDWYTADKVSGMALGLLNALPFNFSFSKRR